MEIIINKMILQDYLDKKFIIKKTETILVKQIIKDI
jgi:hypothetical protein